MRASLGKTAVVALTLGLGYMAYTNQAKISHATTSVTHNVNTAFSSTAEPLARAESIARLELRGVDADKIRESSIATGLGGLARNDLDSTFRDPTTQEPVSDPMAMMTAWIRAEDVRGAWSQTTADTLRLFKDGFTEEEMMEFGKFLGVHRSSVNGKTSANPMYHYVMKAMAEDLLHKRAEMKNDGQVMTERRAAHYAFEWLGKRFFHSNDPMAKRYGEWMFSGVAEAEKALKTARIAAGDVRQTTLIASAPSEKLPGGAESFAQGMLAIHDEAIAADSEALVVIASPSKFHQAATALQDMPVVRHIREAVQSALGPSEEEEEGADPDAPVDPQVFTRVAEQSAEAIKKLGPLKQPGTAIENLARDQAESDAADQRKAAAADYSIASVVGGVAAGVVLGAGIVPIGGGAAAGAGLAYLLGIRPFGKAASLAQPVFRPDVALAAKNFRIPDKEGGKDARPPTLAEYEDSKGPGAKLYCHVEDAVRRRLSYSQMTTEDWQKESWMKNLLDGFAHEEFVTRVTEHATYAILDDKELQENILHANSRSEPMKWLDALFGSTWQATEATLERTIWESVAKAGRQREPGQRRRPGKTPGSNAEMKRVGKK